MSKKKDDDQPVVDHDTLRKLPTYQPGNTAYDKYAAKPSKEDPPKDLKHN